MNYNISLQEMDKLAKNASSKGRKFTLEEMKSQVSKIRKSSVSKVKKK